MLVAIPALALAFASGGCKRKISQAQCDQLLDHFAELVVMERYADAGPETVLAERTRERQEAKHAAAEAAQPADESPDPLRAGRAYQFS